MPTPNSLPSPGLPAGASVLVLGAGLAGVCAAWYLAEAGYRVTVVDRQPGPGLETSFANGGQISVSHPEPWSSPQVFGLLARWLFRENAPVRLRPRLDPRQWAWCLQFLGQCLPGPHHRNTAHIAGLALYSRARLQALRTGLGLNYDQQTRGILHLAFSARELAEMERRQPRLRQFGMAVEVVDAPRCRALEPALAASALPLAGGMYASEDESGDAHLFCRALADACGKAGVRFLHGVTVRALAVAHGRVTGAELTDTEGGRYTLRGDAVVVALGSFSPALVSALGERLSIYPLKGYSVTVPLLQPERAPRVSLTDESARIVVSRLGDRLRLAGTAEIGGYDTAVDVRRCRAILQHGVRLFPQLEAEWTGARFWAGLRPATPGNVPCIGLSQRYANLYYNTGHGTLGWTLACGSAKALADIVAGRQPEPDFPFLTG